MKKLVLIGIVAFSLVIQNVEGTDLTKAVQSNDYGGSKALLFKGVNPNQKDAEGRAPLHYAVLKDNTNLIELLLEAKADINIQDPLGRTPLRYAVMNNSDDAAELLLLKGADPSIADNRGKKPIQDEFIQDIILNNQIIANDPMIQEMFEKQLAKEAIEQSKIEELKRRGFYY